MVKEINISGDDVISMAKVMDHNTRALDKGLVRLRRETQLCVNEISKDISKLYMNQEKMAKSSGKAMRNLGFGILCLDVLIFVQHMKINKLEKKIKQLEDVKVIDDFFFKDEDEDDSLK